MEIIESSKLQMFTFSKQTMNDTIQQVTGNTTENSVNFTLILGIILPFIIFIILLPYLSLAFCTATLYGGMVGLYYLQGFKNFLRFGYAQFDVYEARDWISQWLILYGEIWHGHEIIGLENIPDEPILFVVYHGSIPVDSYFFCARLMYKNRRSLCAIINKNHLKLPLIGPVLKAYRCGAWTKKQCVEILNSGSDLCVLPGGKYESRMSDYKYNIEWDQRIGFAEVALAANVPIVPVFTKNIQEAYWTPWYAKPFTKGKYSSKKQFLNIICGGLPVKLITVIGNPIRPTENLSCEELAAVTKNALQELLDQNQIIPGNKWRALMERVTTRRPQFGIDEDEVEEFFRGKDLCNNIKGKTSSLQEVVFME